MPVKWLRTGEALSCEPGFTPEYRGILYNRLYYKHLNYLCGEFTAAADRTNSANNPLLLMKNVAELSTMLLVLSAEGHRWPLVFTSAE
jgi:hypothetical protein